MYFCENFVCTVIHITMHYLVQSMEATHPLDQLYHRLTKEWDWQREPEVTRGSYRSCVSLVVGNGSGADIWKQVQLIYRRFG